MPIITNNVHIDIIHVGLQCHVQSASTAPLWLLLILPVSFAVAGSRLSRRCCATKLAASTTMLPTFFSSIILIHTSTFCYLYVRIEFAWPYIGFGFEVSLLTEVNKRTWSVWPDRKGRDKNYSFLNRTTCESSSQQSDQQTSFKDNGFKYQTTNDKNDEWKYSQTLMIPGKLDSSRNEK